MAVAGLPAIAAGQEFRYSNAWNNGMMPGAAADAYAGGYVMADPAGYAAYEYPQATYDQAAYQGQVDSQPAGYPQAAGPCHEGNCDHCCPSHCSMGRCLHRSGVFGEFLYWQVTGADLSYGVPQDGISAPGSPTPPGTAPVGDVGVLEYDYEAAFRVGFNVALHCNSSVSVAYTHFETNTDHALFIPAPFVIQPLVLAPGTFNAGFTAQLATAETSLEMETIDLDYRGVIMSCSKYHLNCVAGARYGELDQSFSSVFLFAPPNGTTFVATELDFAGAGLRLGLEGERFILPRMGISLYGKAIGSVLGGEFRGTYGQVNQFNGVEAFTTWEDSRLVPMAEAELGFSWVNRRDTLRFSAGYYAGIWSNVVTTAEWINGVQGLSFVDISRDTYDCIRFDGLVARAELRL
jgi:hypothetical protein